MFVIAGAGLILGALSVAAFFGRYWWPFDLLANFRPQLAVALAGAALLLWLGRWRRTARVVTLVAVLNLGLVGWLWMPADVEPATSSEPFRIVTFNVLAANERYEDVMAYLDRTDADLVFLHEASLPWEEAVEEADLGYQMIRTRDDDHIFGTLVLARGDTEVESFGFTPREPRAVEVRYRFASGRMLAVLGVHPIAPVTGEDAGLRDAQLAFAADWAEGQEIPAVVAGDFNSSPWSHAFRRLVDDAGLRDSQRGFGLQPSFPASSNLAFRIAIDHVLVSHHIAVVDRRLDRPLGSDHFPVVVDILVG